MWHLENTTHLTSGGMATSARQDHADDSWFRHSLRHLEGRGKSCMHHSCRKAHRHEPQVRFFFSPFGRSCFRQHSKYHAHALEGNSAYCHSAGVSRCARSKPSDQSQRDHLGVLLIDKKEQSWCPPYASRPSSLLADFVSPLCICVLHMWL